MRQWRISKHRFSLYEQEEHLVREISAFPPCSRLPSEPRSAADRLRRSWPALEIGDSGASPPATCLKRPAMNKTRLSSTTHNEQNFLRCHAVWQRVEAESYNNQAGFYTVNNLIACIMGQSVTSIDLLLILLLFAYFLPWWPVDLSGWWTLHRFRVAARQPPSQWTKRL